MHNAATDLNLAACVLHHILRVGVQTYDLKKL
jgi:hypothetical protein